MHDTKKVISCLKELGFKPSIIKFEDRLIIQKVVYLLQSKGVKIGFDFHLYTRGPYSACLTTEVYNNSREFESLKTDVELTSKEKQNVEELKSLFELKPSLLEVAATYAYFILQGLDSINALTEVKKLKPFFSEAQLAIGISRVKEFLFRPSQKDIEDMKSEFSAWQSASICSTKSD